MDRIIYTVVDGDGKTTAATFSKDDAYASTGTSGTINPVVYDPDKVGKALLSRMNPVERLCVQNPDMTDDTIVYVTIGNGGGIDGMDRSDKGGDIRYATFYRDIAEKKVDGWSHFGTPLVVVPADVARETLSRLNPAELLCLETHLDGLASKAAPRGPGR